MFDPLHQGLCQSIPGVPTDPGPYAVVIALFILAAIGFSVAVRWLNAYVREQTGALEARITLLEGRLQRFEHGTSLASALMTEVISELPAENRAQVKKLVEACQCLVVK